MTSRIAIIGAGISGLSAAATLAASGHRVVVFDKNSSVGGRARTFKEQGFTFDMGPSWYWMPEIIEEFFNRFGKKSSDYYELIRLDPSYRVYFKNKEALDIPASYAELRSLIEKIEPGGAAMLDLFLNEAKVKYETGMGQFVWKPSLSVKEYFKFSLLRSALKLDLLSPVSKHVRKYFRDPRIIQILEFPVLFLGAKPSATPAMYTMMNYADMKLGTWYPMGGFSQLPEAIAKLAQSFGAEIRYNSNVQKIEVHDRRANGVVVNDQFEKFDAVIGSGDYHHIESCLLPRENRSYSPEYWSKKIMSPSSLIFYLGINKKVQGLQHHNLFFDEPFEAHANSIYDSQTWPEEPQFYVCCPSKTDPGVAPEGMENIFVLVPVAPDMTSDEALRQRFLDKILLRIERATGEDLKPHIIFQRSYAHEEFIADYHSFKGNAYGLANTLGQTGWMKPRLASRKVENLFFAGQLTVPGPGIPPSLISGQLAAGVLENYLKKQKTINPTFV